MDKYCFKHFIFDLFILLGTEPFVSCTNLTCQHLHQCAGKNKSLSLGIMSSLENNNVRMQGFTKKKKKLIGSRKSLNLMLNKAWRRWHEADCRTMTWMLEMKAINKVNFSS